MLDATLGSQRRSTRGASSPRRRGVTGLVLTKLDGTAKGGVAVAVVRDLGVPIRYVGVGESAEDLLPFDAAAFADGAHRRLSALSAADDARWMARALALAARGLGETNPNPMVGCVVVKDGRVVGEGWHRRAGGPHAEVARAARAPAPRPAAPPLYVTLEPCAHQGRTPPCAPARGRGRRAARGGGDARSRTRA